MIARLHFTKKILNGLVGCLILVHGQAAWAGERLTLADAPTLLTGLVALANHLGHFRAADLELAILPFATGDQALQAMEEGRADVATVAETAFVLRLFGQPELRALAVIGGCDNEVRILARRDAGIGALADLRGKRIATQQRLSTHFFLDQVLLKHGMTMADITPVFRKLPELPDLITSGRVDAVITRDPFLSQAIGQLGENAIVLEAPGLYDKVFLLAMLRERLGQRGPAIQKLLTALVRTEAYVRDHGQEAHDLLVRLLPNEKLSSVWHHTRLRLWLDHRFLLTLEDVAAWAMRSQLVQADRVPNFLANIAAEPLRRVRPIAVNLPE
ncbi:MAG: NrtA/SsuA/CpmA family ABC transporter substrate-binding protein [Magnetococcales bacterium]|nr:NrtA/SsuA/CpmA family ABC transporter substrate-binding protein [Magnetococcales bacterium]